MTVALSLPHDLQQFVAQSVESGRYADEAELVREALESLKTQEDFREFQLAKLQRQLRQGLDDMEAGETAAWDSEAVKQKGRALLAARMADF